MIIYAGIDGTSSEEDTYKETFRNSFVNRLYRNELVSFSDTWYLRGPYTSGRDTAVRAEAAYSWVSERWKSGAAKAVFLAGYSRGGAAVIEVAKWLKERDGIPVECLILFDAVDRTDTLGGWIWNTPIASTVRRVVYPQRNVLLTQSRLSFGNCGFMRESDATAFLHDKFFATHGGLGGVPWTVACEPITGVPTLTIWELGEPKATLVTVAADQRGSDQVWSWAKCHIATAYHSCQQRLARENPPGARPPADGPGQPKGPGAGPYPGPGPRKGPKGERIHVVKKGDWLSKIAQTYYGDVSKWKTIYEVPENKRTIGPDPNRIEPGQELIIP